MASATTSPLLDVLRERELQARAVGEIYPAPVAGPESMLFWLVQAAKSARKAADRKQVHIAAEANTDQSTIARFERATSWPQRPEKILQAYARDLEIDEVDLWDEALRLWRQHLTTPEGRGERDVLTRISGGGGDADSPRRRHTS